MAADNDEAIPKTSRSSLFSAKTEYACVSLLELASHHGDPNPLRLKTIAEKHNISHRFLVQILLQLKAAGLVESIRGAAGGYHLARSPEQITIADIVQVIDPADPIRGGDDSNSSALIRAVHGLWADVQQAQRKILETTTLADMVARSQGESDLMYQI
ncbi:RrF2 family transcriptional regulator [Zavarzinella formosa]|uniref:RrF2 family transcriptional regulator n=1 Tax=Zavarzinella formosa TaxID=360055 RepID=UPI0003128A35|nr:Rrf2 family transcriptional regulator [Zavarzinella formosa]